MPQIFQYLHDVRHVASYFLHKFHALYTPASLCSIHFHFDRSTASTKNAGGREGKGLPSLTIQTVLVFGIHMSLRTCVKSFTAAAGKIDRTSPIVNTARYRRMHDVNTAVKLYC